MLPRQTKRTEVVALDMTKDGERPVRRHPWTAVAFRSSPARRQAAHTAAACVRRLLGADEACYIFHKPVDCVAGLSGVAAAGHESDEIARHAIVPPRMT